MGIGEAHAVVLVESTRIIISELVAVTGAGIALFVHVDIGRLEFPSTV